MSTGTGINSAPFTLEARFAEDLPEMAAPWQGEDAPSPELVVLNEDLAQLLGMDPDWLRTSEGVAFLLGRNEEPTTTAVAQAYAGHQFGQFVPSLGDGRALLLGEIESRDGVLRDVHLKGSGRTPFSRGADGRAALGPILREYILSEAMHALGVPTTRSLAVLTTGRKIQRGQVVPGAVLVRVSTSLIRVGSFQYANIAGGIDLSRRLADHVIKRNFPELLDAGDESTPQLYTEMFESIVQKQADLVSKWMRLGFVHGVLNTDNTLVAGETVDYGPCAFMDRYREDAVFSSIDQHGRYRFGNQPTILGWNLARLVETIIPLLGETPDAGMDQAQQSIAGYNDHYRQAWLEEMAVSLGISRDNEDLIDTFVRLLETHSPDVTTLRRALSEDTAPPAGFEEWVMRWKKLGPDFAAMRKVNPIYIPRNHLVEEALLHAVAGDLDPFHTLMSVVTNPFERRDGFAEFEKPSPEGFEEDYMTFCGT